MSGLEELKNQLKNLGNKLAFASDRKLVLIFEDGNIAIPIQYFKVASKGDTIFGTRAGWFIATNLLYEKFRKAYERLDETSAVEVTAIPVKYSPEKKFALIKVLKTEITGIQKLHETEVEKDFEIRYRDFTIWQGAVKKIRNITVKKRIQIVGNEEREEELERVSVEAPTFERLVEIAWEKKDERRYFIKIFDPILGFAYDSHNYYDPYAPSSGFRKEVTFFKGISRKDLLRMSKAFVIAYPEVRYSFYSTNSIKKNEVNYTLYRIFYDGKEYEIPMYNFKPSQLEFRITPRRLALSDHYRDCLAGFNLVNGRPLEFLRLLHYLKDLDYEGIKVKELDPYEKFIEMFFIRTPKRKFEHIRKFIEATDLVKKLIPDSNVTLYITFIMSKKNKNKTTTYPGFRYDAETKDLHVVQTAPPVRVTAIGIKGKFEKDFIEARGIKKLIDYQFAPTQRKLEILKEDIEKLREVLKEKAGKDVTEMHPEKEIIPLLKEIATNGDSNNIAVLVIRQGSEMKKVKATREALLKIAGLLKTGKEGDYTKERLADILRFARIAVKYEIKRHGYSSKLGAMFTGSPEDIVREVLKVIKKVPERLASLTVEMEKHVEEKIGEISVPVSSRINLLSDL